MTKQKMALISIVSIAAIAVVVSIYLWPKDNKTMETKQPRAAIKKQPVQLAESLSELNQIQQLEQTNIATENVEESVSDSLEAQGAKQAQPLAKQADSQLQAQAETDGYEQPIVVTDSNIYSADGNLLAVEMPQAPLTAQQQRHQKRLQQVEGDLRPTYSREQLRRMRKQILANLPQRYQKILENIEQLKQAELERRRLAHSQPRQISGSTYFSDGGAEQTSIKDEKPRFSDTKAYKDKDK